MTNREKRNIVLVGLLVFASMLWSTLWLANFLFPASADELLQIAALNEESWLDLLLARGDLAHYRRPLSLIAEKLFLWLFGSEVWALRLTTIAAGGIFIYYAVAWSRELSGVFWPITGFFILTLHFSYWQLFSSELPGGLGLALTFAALYHYHKYRSVDNGTHLYRTLIYAALATGADLYYLPVYLALCALMPAMAYADGDKSRVFWFQLMRAVVVVSLIGAGLLFPFWESSFEWLPLESSLRTYAQEISLKGLENLPALAAALLPAIAFGFIMITGFLAINDLFLSRREHPVFYMELWFFFILLALLEMAGLGGTPGENLPPSALIFPLVFWLLYLFVLERIPEKPSPVLKIALAMVALLYLVAAYLNPLWF